MAATNRFHVFPVKRLVTLFVVLSVVPLALLTYLSVHLAHNAVEREARARLSAYANETVTTMQQGMTNLSSQLDSYAQRHGLQDALTDPRHPDRALARHQIQLLGSEQTSRSTLILLSRSGRVVASSPASTPDTEDAFAAHSWFRRTVRTGASEVSPAYRSDQPGHPYFIAVATPIKARDGTSAGVLVALTNIRLLKAYADYVAKTLGAKLTLTDQRGLVLAGPGPATRTPASLANDPLVSAALRGRSGTARQDSSFGPALSAYAPIPVLKWTVTVGLPTSTVFARIDRLRSTVYTVAGVLGLVLLAGLGVLMRTLRQRRRAEAQAANSMAALEQARAQAEQAQLQAEQANRAKSEFLSRRSHELRTPLNAILGFGQLLEMDELSGEQDESVDQILKAGGHLLGLINEVLDISRIEAGALSLSLEPVDLRETLDEAVALIRPLADQQQIAMSVEFQDDDAHVNADRQRLKQVLLNLLSNAVKYNRRGGTVRVTVCEVSNAIRLEVADSGAGIPAEKVEQLFRPFERLGADLKQIEGTGLGLVLSKGLVETMGGRIGVDSTAEGSTFWIELQAAQTPIESAHDELRDLASPEAPDTTAATVLYIEDNLSNLRLITRILEQRPEIELISAMHGTLGLDLAEQHQPDLILLDLHLPDLQGDQVLARLRSSERTRDTPVVVLSADATQGRIERLLAQGANDYLSKPIDVYRFLAILDTYIRPRTAAPWGKGSLASSR